MDSDEISEDQLPKTIDLHYIGNFREHFDHVKKICEFSRLREKELEAAIKDYRSLYTSLYRKNMIFVNFSSRYDFFVDIIGSWHSIP